MWQCVSTPASVQDFSWESWTANGGTHALSKVTSVRYLSLSCRRSGPIRHSSGCFWGDCFGGIAFGGVTLGFISPRLLRGRVDQKNQRKTKNKRDEAVFSEDRRAKRRPPCVWYRGPGFQPVPQQRVNVSMLPEIHDKEIKWPVEQREDTPGATNRMVADGNPRKVSSDEIPSKFLCFQHFV